MFKWKWFHVLALLAILSAGALLPQDALAQSGDTVPRVLAAVNADRVANGLWPYKLNSLLTLSAQRHSEYQASIGQWTHNSPDGGLSLQRAQAVGYPAIRANENVYAGNVTPEEAVNWWYTADPAHRNNILHTAMREIGIGAAKDGNGTIYYTMDISAQPNVLPIYINSDAYSTSSPNVTLTLTNEYIFTGAAGRIGQAGQVMISNSADFAGAAAQGWAQSIPWTLDAASGPGQKTVYVRFIDGAGRTADSQDTILLDPNGAAPPPQPTAVPVAPVVPTSAPAVDPARPQPTARPAPTKVPPTTAPTPTSTSAPEVAQQPPPPTLDFSDSQYMRSQRGELVRSATVEDAQPAEPLGGITIRQVLWVALMAGIAAIIIGTLRLMAFRRAWLAHKETSPDGDG